MMEVVMEEGGDISGCSSTTTTTLDDDIGGCAWADWAPIVDWGMLSGGDDFHGLMESMAQADLDDESLPITVMDDDANGMSGGPTPTCSSSSSPGSPRELEDDGRGLRLVHLLMAAAETLGGPPEGRELARVILVRLKQLATPTATAAAAGASNMERLAAHFADALQSLIDGPSGRHRDDRPPAAAAVAPPHAAGDVLAAFQLLQDMSPYVKFGHFTANQAILEAVAGDRRVHVVDYDIMEGIQWASLMQALASRKDGPPAPHLRITAITRSGGSGGGKRSIGTVQETGRRLAAFAASIGQPFSFSQCRLDADENFRPTGVKIVKGEALVVNCMLHLPHSPHRSSASISSFLSGSSTLSPRLVTLVEEEEEEEAAKQSGFVGRFMEALYRYSAVCDSLEAGFPMQGRARGLVERVFLGPRIAGAVARAYNGRGGEGWGKWMTESGFRRVPITFFNQCQARLLLGLFHDGYRVEEVALNKLVLAWKSRRLLSASVWSPPAVAGGGGGGGGREDSDTLMLDSSPSSA